MVIAISVAGGYCQSQKVSFIIGGDKGEMDKYFAITSIVGVVVVVGVIKGSVPSGFSASNGMAFVPSTNMLRVFIFCK